MAQPLITHLVTFKPADPSDKLPDSIGGHPYLPKGTDYPVCSCGERMSLYFQFDIREEFGLRAAFGLPWRTRERVLFRSVIVALRLVVPLLPDRIRVVPQARRYEARVVR